MVGTGRSPAAPAPSRESSAFPTSFQDWFSPCVSPPTLIKGPCLGRRKGGGSQGAVGALCRGRGRKASWHRQWTLAKESLETHFIRYSHLFAGRGQSSLPLVPGLHSCACSGGHPPRRTGDNLAPSAAAARGRGWGRTESWF